MRKMSWQRSITAMGAALLVALAAAFPAFAIPAAVLSDRDKADVARIEAYLNDLRTMKARFLQVASTGEYAEGSLLISRPGKMRIEYDPPVPVLIVATGTWLIYHDKELEQVSHVLLSSTPAGILLQENVSFSSDDVLITGFERGANVLRLSVVRKKDPMEGSLTLVVSDKPLSLKKWIITDAQGVQTTVSLMGPRFGMPLDGDLFNFVDPNFFSNKDDNR
jgi:outer membrane lipoprotein-sorting protein